MFNMLTNGLNRFSIQLSSFKTNTANTDILRHTLLCSFILCFCILVCSWTHNAAWFYGSVLKVKYVFGDSDLSQFSSSALIFFLLLCVSLSVIVFWPFFFSFRMFEWVSNNIRVHYVHQSWYLTPSNCLSSCVLARGCWPR